MVIALTAYQVLGINSDSSQDQIKSAYRQKAIQYHPDRNQTNSKSEEIFKKVLHAYTLIKTPEKRNTYDNKHPVINLPDIDNDLTNAMNKYSKAENDLANSINRFEETMKKYSKKSGKNYAHYTYTIPFSKMTVDLRDEGMRLHLIKSSIKNLEKDEKKLQKYKLKNDSRYNGFLSIVETLRESLAHLQETID